MTLDEVEAQQPSWTRRFDSTFEESGALPASSWPRKGNMDDEIVAQVQCRLHGLAYIEVGNVDGVFGDLTEDAIVVFLRREGLPANGRIDTC